MILTLDDTERAEYLASLVRERFGGSIPWSECHRKPKPIPNSSPAAMTARRRELCLAIDGHYTDDLPVSLEAA